MINYKLEIVQGVPAIDVFSLETAELSDQKVYLRYSKMSRQKRVVQN